MTRVRLWLRGWVFYWRAVYLMRAKTHGAGAAPWRYAFRTASHARFIVYGQHYR
jgi:hypothetical protein